MWLGLDADGLISALAIYIYTGEQHVDLGRDLT